MEKLIICGAAGHAKVLADIARLRGFEVLGFLDDVDLSRRGEAFGGAAILGGTDYLEKIRGQNIKVIVGFGLEEARLSLGLKLEEQGFQLATLIHPQTIIASGVQIGAGSSVVAGAIINPDTRIGKHCVINTGATVDHDCVIGDGASVSPGVHLAGNVKVGKATMLGIGAVARHRITIGERCIIGAGSVIVSDIPDGVLAYGVPAKVVRRL